MTNHNQDDTQLVLVGAEFYALEAIMEEEMFGETKFYALLMAVKPNAEGKRGGHIVRFYPEKPDEEALEPIEDPFETALIMERVKAYFKEKGADIEI